MSKRKMEDLNDSSLSKTPAGKGKRLLKSKSKIKIGVTPSRKRKKLHTLSGKHNSSFNTSRIVIENLNTNNRALKFEHQKVLNEIKLRTLKCNQVREENEDLLLELPTLENVLNLTASEEKRKAVIDQKVEVYMQRLINLIGKSMKDVHEVLQSSKCIIQMLQVSNKIIDLPIIGDTEGEEFSFEERLGSILSNIKSGNDTKIKEETIRNKMKLDNISHPINVGLPQRILNAQTPADEAGGQEMDILPTLQKENKEISTNISHKNIIQSPATLRKISIIESPQKKDIKGAKSPLKENFNSKTGGDNSACLQENVDDATKHDTIDYSYTDMEMTEVIDASISFMVPPNTSNTHPNHIEQLSTTLTESRKITEPVISEEHSEKLEINVDRDDCEDVSCVQDSNKSYSPVPSISMEINVTPQMCSKKPFTEIDENTTDNCENRTHGDIKLVSETESSSEDTPQKSKIGSKRMNGCSRSKGRRQLDDYVEEDEEVLIIPDSCKKKKPLRESPFLSQQQNMQEDKSNENMMKRPKRSKEQISYKERPINIKMRKE